MKRLVKHQHKKRAHGELTLLLSNMSDPESLNAATRMVYDDLHRMAAGHFRGERRSHTL